jgi:23S rRNA pseudouridine2605 synthase
MAADSAGPERLQKALARAGLGSRREIEGWIRAGRLTVNGAPAALGTRIEAADQVKLDGRPVRRGAEPNDQVFLLHRSTGESLRAAREDAVIDPLLERLPRRSGRRYITVSPMPRMDGGLELVTSDGALAARLQRAVRSLPCEFSVRVHGEFGAEVLERILVGELDRGSRLQVLRCEAAGGAGSNRWYEVEALGASGRDIRQLFERQGALVSRVLRTRLGAVRLGRQLARGQFRRLDPQEVQSLLEPPPTSTPTMSAPVAVKIPGSRRSRLSPRGRSDQEE